MNTGPPRITEEALIEFAEMEPDEGLQTQQPMIGSGYGKTAVIQMEHPLEMWRRLLSQGMLS